MQLSVRLQGYHGVYIFILLCFVRLFFLTFNFLYPTILYKSGTFDGVSVAALVLHASFEAVIFAYFLNIILLICFSDFGCENSTRPILSKTGKISFV